VLILGFFYNQVRLAAKHHQDRQFICNVLMPEKYSKFTVTELYFWHSNYYHSLLVSKTILYEKII
jgi:hypothetical protein